MYKRLYGSTLCSPARQSFAPLLFVSLLAATAGCDPTLRFPVDPMARGQHVRAQALTYDTDGNQRPDYWQRLNDAGRVVELRFDDDRNGEPDAVVDLSAVDAAEVPHFIIALDGCPYVCAEQAYRQGRLRLFRPPVRVISPFPAMTDVALSRVWHVGPCRGYEALWFDRQANRLNNGILTYLAAENSPWVPKTDYRCSFLWDASAYLTPQLVFDHEMRGLYRTFKRVERGTASGYTVGTAGLGTRGGREAFGEILRRVDRLCQQIVLERRGRVTISILSDHGHGLMPCRRVTFGRFLTERGFHLGKRLEGPNDAVTVEYGLVTYAAFWAKQPEALGEVLRDHHAVELTFVRGDGEVIVLSPGGRAVIRRQSDGYVYDQVEGDPLRLGPLVDRLRAAGHVAAEGVIDDRTLLAATADHLFPDPLHRAWWAFNGVTEISADVIVSLHNGFSHGGGFFDAMIGGAESTHGSIDRLSSTAFAMTMRGLLPPVLRSEDVLAALERAGGKDRPDRRAASEGCGTRERGSESGAVSSEAVDSTAPAAMSAWPGRWRPDRSVAPGASHFDGGASSRSLLRLR